MCPIVSFFCAIGVFVFVFSDGKEQIMVKNEKFSDFAIDLFFPIQLLNIDWGGEVANLYDSSRVCDVTCGV